MKETQANNKLMYLFLPSTDQFTNHQEKTSTRLKREDPQSAEGYAFIRQMLVA